jgi:hypothetical protein
MQGARAAISCPLAALALPGYMPATTPLGTSLGPGDTVQVGERCF